MPPKGKVPSKDAPEAGQTRTATARTGNRPPPIRIVDTPGIPEHFANQLLDVFLGNSQTISMTFGAKRTHRDSTEGKREPVIAVNARLTIDLATAEALRNALAKVIALTKQPTGSVN